MVLGQAHGPGRPGLQEHLQGCRPGRGLGSRHGQDPPADDAVRVPLPIDHAHPRATREGWKNRGNLESAVPDRNHRAGQHRVATLLKDPGELFIVGSAAGSWRVEYQVEEDDAGPLLAQDSQQAGVGAPGPREGPQGLLAGLVDTDHHHPGIAGFRLAPSQDDIVNRPFHQSDRLQPGDNIGHKDASQDT